MSKFQVGQRVRLVNDGGYKGTCATGDIGTVTEPCGSGAEVQVPGYHVPLFFRGFEIELIQEPASASDEFDVMREVFKLLRTLDPTARERVLGYAQEHLT